MRPWSALQACLWSPSCAGKLQRAGVWCVWGGLLRWFQLNWKFLSRLYKLAPFQRWKFNKLDGAGRVRKKKKSRRRVPFVKNLFHCGECRVDRRLGAGPLLVSLPRGTYCWALKASVFSARFWIKSNLKAAEEHALWFPVADHSVWFLLLLLFFPSPCLVLLHTLILAINDFVNWTNLLPKWVQNLVAVERSTSERGWQFVTFVTPQSTL